MLLVKKRIFPLWSLVLAILLFGWIGCAEEATDSKLVESPTKQVVLPNFSLITNMNQSWTLFCGGEVVVDGKGSFEGGHLNSGDYQLEVESIDGYTVSVVPAGSFTMNAEEPLLVNVVYRQSQGDLAIYCKTAVLADLEAVYVTIVDDKGVATEYPKETDSFSQNREPQRRIIFIPNLKSGEYTLNFTSKREGTGLRFPAPQVIHIEAGQTAVCEQVFELMEGGIDVKIAFESGAGPQVLPSVKLLDDKNKVVIASKTGFLKTEHLVPGKYTIVCEELTGYLVPEPISVVIKPGVILGPLKPMYEDSRGELQIVYDTGPDEPRLDAVRFWLTLPDGERSLYPAGNNFTYNSEAHTRAVSIPELPNGVCHVEFLLPNSDGFFSEVESQEVEVVQGNAGILRQSILPNFASINAHVDISDIQEGSTEMPFMRIYDGQGKLVVESKTGDLQYSTLLPGSYTLAFQSIPGKGSSPPEQYFVAKPGAVLGPFYGNYGAPRGVFSLSSNMVQGWTLFRDGKVIMDGEGSVQESRLPVGSYQLEVEPIHGYSVGISPGTSFVLNAEAPVIVNVTYKEAYGGISLDAKALGNPSMGITLVPIDKSGSPSSAIEVEVGAQDNRLAWQNKRLPVGKYQMSYQLPPTYQPIGAQEVVVSELEAIHLSPTVQGFRSIHVNTNEANAEYTLNTSSGETIATGSGTAFSFVNLIPGEYRLAFHTLGDSYATPQEQVVVVPREKDITTSGIYRLLGVFDISANVPSFKVHISSLEGSLPAFDQEVNSNGKSLTVPEGKYRIEFSPLSGNLSARYGDDVPNSIEFVVRFGKTEKIHGLYEVKQGSLVVSSNLPQAGYTVKDVTLPSEPLIVGHFQGEHTVVPFTYVGKYEISFDDIYNYRTPSAVQIEIGNKERKMVGGNYLPREKVVPVHAGPVIVGDVFGDGAADERPSRTVDLSDYSVGVHLVTNEQFAEWLTRALHAKKVQYIRDSAMRGQVTDLSGNLLFETFLADKDSQIRMEMNADQWVFKTIEGKEQYPVVEVSWYGAMMYCQDNGFRLPTEAEWERAAGMAIVQPGAPLKKYRYGFSQDDINLTWANYLETFNSLQHQKVMTRPVGFYDGVNLLEYNSDLEADARRDPLVIETLYGAKDARSPVGCYDMSGNVREWVADWYGEDYYRYMPSRDPQGPAYGAKKVTKGGSYNSFAFELRTSARMPLSPETTDAFTGFRIVVDSIEN